ncbi:MAG: CHAT domain-containing protein [Aureispira sp.]|nr:CHAT domain-containing protein [Aureispira sp.]
MKYEDAKESYQIAGDWYRKNGYSQLYSICYNGIGNIYIDLTLYEKAKYEGFKKTIDLLEEMKSIEPSLAIDSNLIADAYEGYGRYYMNVAVASQDTNDLDIIVRFDTAMAYFNKALDIRTRLNGPEHSKVALSYYYIGRCYRGFSVITDSIQIVNLEKKGVQIDNPIKKELEYLEKALALQIKILSENHYQVANTYQALGNYYYEIKKDYEVGFDYQKKALKIRQKLFEDNHPKIAASYSELATYYRVMNMFDNELKCLEKALSIQLEILGEEHKDIARNYYLMGNRYRRAGDYEHALTYYQQSLDILIKLQNKNNAEVADVYFGMALCYRELENAPSEFSYLNQSKEIRQKIFGKDHFTVGEIYMELGTYHASKHRYDSTLQYYSIATEIWENQLGENPYFLSKAYDKLAYAYQLKKDTEKEFEYLNKALNMRLSGTQEKAVSQLQFGNTAADLDFSSNEDPKIALGYQLYSSYLNLAYFYKRKEDYRLALTYCQKALMEVSPSLGKDVDIYKNPTINELSHNIDWLEALQQKGELFYKIYDLDSEKSEDLKFSLSIYEEALSLVDTLRLNSTSDGAKQLLTKRAIPVYEGAIVTLYRLFQNTKDDIYLTNAFETMERSKAFVLLQAIQNIEAKGFSDVPAELLAKEDKLRRSLSYYSDYKNRTSKNQKDFDQAYFRNKRAYDSLVTVIETNYPSYYKLKYNTQVASISKIQNELLSHDKMLLEYFVGDRHIYIFKITKSSKNFYKIPVPHDFMLLVKAFRKGLTDYQLIGKDPTLAYKNFVAYSSSFYQRFIGSFLDEIPKDINQLVIIPDGLLNYIPFEVLITSTPSNLSTPDYKSLDFLIEHFDLYYSYSSTLLLENNYRQKNSHNGKCIGFAPTYENSSNSDLPWAEKELKAIEKVFRGDYYYGEQASKDVFKQEGANYGIIHLAMHGIVNMRNPLQSKLAFSQSEDDVDENKAYLFAHEVHEMVLNADLVVLSACETGIGKVIRGEGVLSLARAFMYAGTPSVVTTLWKVNDFTSATLMGLFYSNLADGMPKHEALRKAKLDFLSQSDQISGHPAFWASFIAIGDPSPIETGWSWMLWFVILLILGGISATAYYFWKRRADKLTNTIPSTVATIETIREEHRSGKDQKEVQEDNKTSEEDTEEIIPPSEKNSTREEENSNTVTTNINAEEEIIEEPQTTDDIATIETVATLTFTPKTSSTPIITRADLEKDWDDKTIGNQND